MAIIQKRNNGEILSRRQIEGRIADGDIILIIDQQVLKVNSWLKYHPGGERVIHHMVGRDATDEVNAMHSKETRLSMDRFQIGRLDGPWENLLPPLHGGQYQSHTDDMETSQKSECSSKIPSSREDDFRRRRPPASAGASESPEPYSNAALAFLDGETKKERELDLTKYPAVDFKSQQEIISKYRALDRQLRSEGFYECNYMAYGWEAARCLAILCTMLFFYHRGWYGTSGAFMGMLWWQLVFIAHDAAHMGITHDFTIDSLIAMTLASAAGGLSIGWWKDSHNVHHIVTNAPEHDPDNQHLPFLAVTHEFLGSLFSTYHRRFMPYDAFARLMVPWQAYAYYPLLTLGRFNLYVQSWAFLLRGAGPRQGAAWWHRWYEIAGNLIFWLWYGYGLCYHIPGHGPQAAFVMASHLIVVVLHVQLTLSHFAMSTADLGPAESFPQRMLRTTMDIDCPPALDFFHGGLQFQAAHHLFPRLPRHNLRRAQRRVMAFCDDVGVPYALFGFVDVNKKVLGSLEQVSRQAAILAECQRVMAAKGI